MNKNHAFLEEAINNVFTEGTKGPAKLNAVATEIANDVIDFMNDKIADMAKEKQIGASALNEQTRAILKLHKL